MVAGSGKRGRGDRCIGLLWIRCKMAVSSKSFANSPICMADARWCGSAVTASPDAGELLRV